MVLSIPCGEGAIRVYERPRGGGPEPQMKYQAAFIAGTGTRLWGGLSTSILSIVASLWSKLKLKQEQTNVVWVEALKLIEKVQPAMSHKSRIDSCPSAVVFFGKHPFEGTVRPRVRKADGKVRMELSRKGHGRV